MIDEDLCIACGACIPACPTGQIEPAFSIERGTKEVKINNPSDCIGCPAPCEAVCPSIQTDFVLASSAVQHRAERPKPSRDGWIESLYLAHSPTFVSHAKSSSGGVLRTLVTDAVERGIPVITLVSKESEEKVDYVMEAIDSVEDLKRLPGSIYHSTSSIGAIDLLRESPVPCRIVAIPCQLAGMLQYIARHEPALGKKIELICGIVCGWMYSHHTLNAFATYKGIQGPIRNATYRGGGDKVGKLRLTTLKETHEFSRRKFDSVAEQLDYQASFSTDLNRMRCRVCEDHLNMLADVIAGDAWLKRKGKQKLSIMATRTPRGEAALQALAAQGKVILEPSTFDDVVESQSSNLVYGHTARKLNTFLHERGSLAPHYQYEGDTGGTPISARDRGSFWMEIKSRAIVRQGAYRLYRQVYLLKRLRRYIKPFARAALKRIKP